MLSVTGVKGVLGDAGEHPSCPILEPRRRYQVASRLQWSISHALSLKRVGGHQVGSRDQVPGNHRTHRIRCPCFRLPNRAASTRAFSYHVAVVARGLHPIRLGRVHPCDRQRAELRLPEWGGTRFFSTLFVNLLREASVVTGSGGLSSVLKHRTFGPQQVHLCNP